MTKSNLKIIIAASAAAFIINLLFGKFLMGKISTWPLLNRFNILSPQAPIVINNREEIRLVDSGQFNDAVNSAKSKISSVVLKEADGLSFKGSALNLTSDGSFVTYKDVFSSKGEYWIILQDGEAAKIISSVGDPASGLVFFKAQINNLPIAPLADSKSLAVGEKVVFFSSLPEKDSYKAWPDYITTSENTRNGQIFVAGKISRSFKVLGGFKQPDVAAVLNIKGEVAGLFGGGIILPADVIKSATALFLSGQEKISRPDFGFSYTEVSQTQSEILQIPLGAKVIDAEKLSLFKPGDVIIEVSGKKTGQAVFLEEILEQFKVGDAVVFKVARGDKVLDLSVKPKELK